MKKAKGYSAQEVMLGRKVVRNSPASLQLGDMHEQIQSMMMQQYEKTKKQASEGGAAAGAALGGAISGMGGKKWGTDTQSPAFKAQRAGERMSY